MGRIRRDIEYAVDTGIFYCLGILLRVTTKGASFSESVTAEFAAAITHENQLYFLPEPRRVVDIIQRDAPSAEKADVRKHIEVGQCDRLGFHPSHG